MTTKTISYLTALIFNDDLDESRSAKALVAQADASAQVKITHYANLGAEPFSRAAAALIAWAGDGNEAPVRRAFREFLPEQLSDGRFFHIVATNAPTSAQIIAEFEDADLSDEEYYTLIDDGR
ncbi:hypothetical protein CCR94_02345 [Rhodoblastus sphagnicola]|uniref:Uncharacterized protein n=1 Tax=Rhodoblastus sphagnicola TaxID=333368 RepID=A0A2S6NF44_9HYPH|nr:hypothetical protein [Rhodoblastus sphagnicola]MBB4200222.1 hypothetical protein [Rhodoblastus sphagnicola]PPQ33262.1 hypothetical protein CCR94_02345 [Rhodoblastus sphagnicola]